jgi:PAS domain S-box-containing protein
MLLTALIASVAALVGIWSGFLLQGLLRRRHEEHYRAIADEASDVIVVHENNRIVFTSAAMKRILDRRPEEFEAGRYLDIVHPDDVHEARKLLGTPSPGETRRATYRVQHRNGEYVWFEVSTRAVYDEAGEFVREISLGRDISERKRQEAVIIAAQQHAEAANRAKSLFLSTMSHELRTPLNAIIGFSEILKQQMFGQVGNARYAEYADNIHASGRHLLGVINDILDMTKLDTDQVTLELADVDLRAEVEDCLVYVGSLARKAKVGITADIPVLVLRADPTRLRQILFNVLSNAIKFTEEGGRVAVGARADGDKVVITITDNGIGMKREDLPLALAPFGQIDNALNRRHEGVGLGLPLSKRLIELHDGQLSIASAKGTGTTVRIVLPGYREIAALRAAS